MSGSFEALNEWLQTFGDAFAVENEFSWNIQSKNYLDLVSSFTNVTKLYSCFNYLFLGLNLRRYAF